MYQNCLNFTVLELLPLIFSFTHILYKIKLKKIFLKTSLVTIIFNVRAKVPMMFFYCLLLLVSLHKCSQKTIGTHHAKSLFFKPLEDGIKGPFSPTLLIQSMSYVGPIFGTFLRDYLY